MYSAVPTRRDALKLIAGAASACALRTASASEPGPSLFPRPATPADAFALLAKGNERYLSGKMESFSANIPALRKAAEPHQEPFAAILSCADSRVPAEIIFDQSLGSLFVVRVAGNIAAPDTIASLEYAAAELHVKAILVLGHTGCGAVKAASAVSEVPGQISSLYQYIHPAVISSGGKDLNETVRKNAELQAETLREDSPVIHALVAKGQIAVHSAVYEIGSGKVTFER